MELDELKAKWQTENKQNSGQNKEAMEALKLNLKDKTGEALTQIKAKYEKIISLLFVGIFINALASPFLHFLLGDEGPVFRITLGGLLSLTTVILICLMVIFFYWIKYTNIQTSISDNLKEGLSQNINHLKRSLKQEIGLIAAIFVSTFILARVSSQYLGNGAFGDIFRTDIMLSIAAMISLMAFFIFKRVKHYSRNITELQDYLNKYSED